MRVRVRVFLVELAIVVDYVVVRIGVLEPRH